MLVSKPWLRALESGKFQDFPPTWSTAGREQSGQAVLLGHRYTTLRAAATGKMSSPKSALSAQYKEFQ